MNPSHVKAIARKEQALLGLETAIKQREGLYDYLTMPFAPLL